MSKIFLILSAVLVLASAGLSFLNKNKLTDSIAYGKTEHADATSAHADATKSKQGMAKAQAEAKNARDDADASKAALTGAQAQVATLEGKLKTSDDALAAKDAQLTALNTKLSEISNKPGGTDPTQIAAQIDELKRSRDELQVVKDGLEKELTAARTQMASAAEIERKRKDGVLMVGLRGRVLAVDRNWNFVVLSVGDRQGIINNATLVIQRGGSLVGRVKVTSVEPSQAIADIIPNSVPAGITVQEGDTVVFPGS